MINQMVKHYQHGLSAHPLYHTWENMRARCNNPNNDGYKWYGARGIRICKRWDNFANFVSDVGEKPKNMTLDRINNNGNYEPGNVRWVNQIMQGRNSRTRITNKTGTKGVWYNKRYNKYQVSIRINYKLHYLGWFATLDEAIAARQQAEKTLWGPHD